MTALQNILSRLRSLAPRPTRQNPEDAWPLDLGAAQARLKQGGYHYTFLKGRLVARAVENHSIKGLFYRDVVLQTRGDLSRFLQFKQFV